VVVADPLDAMGRLARAVLDRLPDLTVVGVTGSSGKTTTKDQIGQLLAGSARRWRRPARSTTSSACRTPPCGPTPTPAFLVLEMGARGIGHISYLCGIAPPRIGVVINVGVAHIGEFGSVEAIAKGKAELVEALPAGGLAVLNADDPLVRTMAERTRAEVLLVGEAADADLRAVDVTLDERGRPSYTLIAPEGEVRVALALTGGIRWATRSRPPRWPVRPACRWPNSRPPLAICGRHRPEGWMSTTVPTVSRSSTTRTTRIPASTAAALRAQAALGEGRRRVAVLGYLAELGAHERDGHEQVGRLAAELGVDRLVVVGAAAKPIHDGAVAVAQWGGESVHVTDQGRPSRCCARS
jgi:UDP-N-acetylmuramoyl-tripeptide--D-alanyl-D-alanine ligase